jgi:hypothetical protein
MKPVLHKIPVVCCIAFLGSLVAGCIFDENQPVAPLTMQYVGNQGDTVSPLAVLRFTFSDSLASSLDFDFSPPVAQNYGITVNPATDTATLSFIEMLPGNTRFVIKLKSMITSRGGSTLSPGNDSTVIFTGAKEQEPNNDPALADTLKPPAIYGMLPEASDTDVYYVPSKHDVLYLKTFTGQISLSVKDSLLHGVRVTGGLGADAADTFTVPDSTLFPIYVYIFSPIKGVTGFYRLGLAQ